MYGDGGLNQGEAGKLRKGHVIPDAVETTEEATTGDIGWCRDAIVDWILREGRAVADPAAVLQGVCERLVRAGLPLLRMSAGLRSMHPEVFARTYLWQRGGAIQMHPRDFAVLGTPTYLASPVRLIHEGAGAIRVRLEEPGGPEAFEICRELADLGGTDYVIMPLELRGSRPNFISWTIDRPGGFRGDELRLIDEVMPALSLRLELDGAYDARDTLLRTYLGREPARRVLAGSVRRGDVESIRAVVLLSDLRDFTGLSDREAPKTVIELLDAYFDVMAAPIESLNGEILKFFRDGPLAIFPVGEGDPAAACATALAAVLDAQSGLLRENRRRRAEGLPEIACGIALHLGDVQFGNIGARGRLDFTVIGPAVNEASRVEQLSKVLGHKVLVTRAFAEAAPAQRLEPLGVHTLRGVREPQEVYALTAVEPVG